MSSKAKVAVAAVVTALSCTGALWAYQGRRGPEPLRAAGTIESRDIQVGSLVGGRVTHVHVQEGDSVSVWRGVASKEVDTKASPEKRDKNVNKAAEKLLKNYPPATSG